MDARRWVFYCGLLVLSLSGATVSAWLSYAEAPFFVARDTLKLLDDGRSIDRQMRDAAIQNVELAMARNAQDARYLVAHGRLSLAGFRHLEQDQQVAVTRVAHSSFLRAVTYEPVARTVWRNLIVTELILGEDARRIDDLAWKMLLLEPRDAFGRLTLLEIALRYPEMLSADTRDQALEGARKLEHSWAMRRPLVELFLRLPEPAQSQLKRQLDDSERFEVWVKRMS